MPKGTKYVEHFLEDVNYPEANWQLSAVAKTILRKKMLLNTDALYLVAARVDAQWNSPELVRKVAKLVADTRNLSMKIMIGAAARNAKTFYRF